MKKLVMRLPFLLVMFFTLAANAQNKGDVSGRVINAKDKTPIDYATVAVKSLKDSSVVGSMQTDAKGAFSIKGIPAGNYRLVIAFLGLKNVNKDFSIPASGGSVNVGVIAMEDTGLNLNTVDIKGEAIPVVVKKDTVEFNASSYKVRENAVVEDVLKKIPGVEVNKDGSVKAQGESITKVKVDGKEFFGNDPLLATKNLPADMIDKIQVIDDLSDQAKFTGVDDGNRTKILNITTRKDKKKGYFGNANLGYGSDDRYDVSLNVNRFDNEQQLSVVGQFNNVNKQNFGGGGFGGGFGGGRGGFGGGGGRMMINFGGNSGGSGITTTDAAGFNFSDTYSDQTQINGSYFYNKGSLLNLQNSVTQNLLGDATTIFNNNLNGTSTNINHRLNFMVDTQLDSLTSIRVQPYISYTENNGNNLNDYTNDFGTYQTIGNQQYKTHSTSPNINNNILIRKKFLRRGRTLSLNVNTSISDNDADNYNYILDKINNSGAVTQDLTDQYNDQGGSSVNNTTRLVYTEPLSKTMSLELNYQNTYGSSNSDRYTYNFNPATMQYDLVDNAYTNQYKNMNLTNALGFSFNKNEKKYNWNIGLAVQNTDRKNTNLTNGSVLKQNFYNLTPSAALFYNFSSSKRLRIRYRGQTNQPSINQIQPIPDNTNTQSIQLGNPGLKPSFNNNLFFFFNNFEVSKNRSLFAFLNLSQTSNAFGNSTNLITSGDNKGKIEVTPINVDGVYSGIANISLGIPLVKENKLNMNVSLRGNYDRNVNFTNTIKNITNSWGVTNGYKFVSNFNKFDFTAGISGSVTRATYSAQPKSNTRFYTLNPSIDMGYMFPGNVRLAMDLDYIKNTGRGPGFDTEYTLVNSYISRQFFNNRGTFKLSVNDAFNQNQGISRTATNNTITDLSTNVLKRYYLFTFTYTLNRIGGRTMQGDQMMPGMGGRERRFGM